MPDNQQSSREAPLPDTCPIADGDLPTNAGRPRHRRRLLTAGLAAPLVYAGCSFLAGLIFWLVTTFTGSHTHVARWGGAAWIFLLFMIVLMPIVIPRMKGRR